MSRRERGGRKTKRAWRSEGGADGREPRETAAAGGSELKENFQISESHQVRVFGSFEQLDIYATQPISSPKASHNGDLHFLQDWMVDSGLENPIPGLKRRVGMVLVAKKTHFPLSLFSSEESRSCEVIV